MNEIFEENKKLKKLYKTVSETGWYLWQKGWAERNAGNISVNVDHIVHQKDAKPKRDNFFDLPETFDLLKNKCFLISATGSRMRNFVKGPRPNAMIIKINPGGNKYCILGGKKGVTRHIRPSSELPTHLGIHQMIAERGSNEKVVLHTHATELIALTHHPEMKSPDRINKILWGMHPETIIFIPKGLGFVPYELPGSNEIARATIELLKKHDMVLWEKHGVFSVGNSVPDTFDQIDIACKSAKIWFLCKSAGFEPEGLTDEQLRLLKELAEKFNQ